MSDYNNSALTLYSVKFSADKGINEKNDKGSFIPDGKRIAFIQSNFDIVYHIDYKYLLPNIKSSEKPITSFVDDHGNKLPFPADIIEGDLPKKSNRGRKKKPVKGKTEKKDGGSDTKFCSKITFGVIHPPSGKVHGMKVFRVNSGNIYTISGEDFKLAEFVVQTVFAFINECKPQVNIRLTGISIKLRNMNFRYFEDNSPPTGDAIEYRKYVINTFRLKNILTKGDFAPLDILGETKIALVIRDTKTIVRIMFNYDGSVYNFNLSPSGKLYSYGGKREDVIFATKTFIFGVIDANRESVVQLGIKALQASELKKLQLANA